MITLDLNSLDALDNSLGPLNSFESPLKSPDLPKTGKKVSPEKVKFSYIEYAISLESLEYTCNFLDHLATSLAPLKFLKSPLKWPDLQKNMQ